MYEYEQSPRISYEGAQFIRVCSKCGRFVKADPEIVLRGEQVQAGVPNATCRKCGRVEMVFEGWW